jgi:hypothetical protein
MSDFIFDLKGDIITAMPDVNEMWAEVCALMPVATVLPNTTIFDTDGPVHLNVYGLGVGPAGIKKTLPMFGWTYRLIKNLGERIGRDLLLPSRGSVPGLIKFLSETNAEGRFIQNHGILIRDEFTGMFKEMREAHWQNDALEFVSEMYDGTSQKRYTLKDGLMNPPNMYVNILSATTFDFTNIVDYRFYKQGTGNRILYTFFDPKDYKVERKDASEYFSESCKKTYDEAIEKYTKLLVEINKKMLSIEVLGLDPDAGDIWTEYKHKCDTEWHKRLLEDPNGWSFHPIRRYAEFALKLSGSYAVSEFASSTTMPIITEKAMNRAITMVEKNRIAFEKIVQMKASYNPPKKVESMEDQAKTELMKVAYSKYKGLTTEKWYDAMDTTTNRYDKNEIRKFCKSKGWIKCVGYSDLTQEERKNFGVTNHNSKVWLYVGGL